MKNLKFTIFCFAFFFVTNSLKSQNITATIGSINSSTCAVGDTLVIPITTTMASGISTSAISLAFDYDSTKLQCISSVTGLNSAISAGFLSNCGLFSNLSPNAPYSATTRRQFRAAWFALNPVTVNGVMFNLRFRVLATGNTTIKWDVATPGNCEFADEFADVIPNVSWVHSSIVCGCGPSSITAAGPTTFCQGGSVVLNAISGTGLTYQWQNNGSNISGATNASYTATTSGSYTVVVFNAPTCSTVSAATIVTVTAPPSAGTLSGSQAVCVGGTSNLISTVPGGTWSSSAPGVATVNASTGLVTGVTGGTATMTYTVTGTGGCANVSATRTITVTDPPAAVTLGGNQAVCVAGTSTFNSTISGGTWTSNDPTIATVDAASGLVTGVAAGTATISYTVTGTGGCANVSATRTITVTDPPSAGTLSGNQEVCVGGTSNFTSTVSGGAWSSSATGVATINASTGLVTGVSAGTTTMTYTITGTGGCSNATATRTVTVTAAPSAGTLSGNQAVCVAGMTTFTSTVSGGTWTSNDPTIATVGASSGLVTGVAAGTATISYTVTGTGGCANVSATRTITVTDPPSAGTLSGNQEVCVGGTSTFSSTVPGGTWSSSTLSVAIINASTGLITSVTAGTATMTYTVIGTGGCANVSATRTITVTDPPAPGTLSGNQAVCVAGMTTFTSTVSGGTWSSSDATIATVNPLSGLVTGVAFGTTAINYTVTGTGGCSDVTGTRSVTVASPPSAGSLSGNQAVCVGSTTIFTSTVSGGTWSSSNTAVASVNSSTGLITGVGAGTANITYTVEGTGGCLDATASLSIQVVEPPLLTNQPLPQSVPIGQNAVFTIGHNSTNSTLQWQADLGWGFQDLTNAGQYSGVNSPTLTVSNTAFHNNNQLYRCLVYSNLCSSGVTSDVVSLSVVARQNTANVPARFNFQSVIRDTTGALVANRSLGVRITLNRGPQIGTLYSETHQLTSNSNGLITTSIGGGTPVVGSMDSIDWSLGDVYIKTEVDVNGGSNYEMLSSNQLLSVPYALFAQNSGSGAPGPAGPQGPMGPAGPQGIQGPAGPAGGGGSGTLAIVRTVGVTEVMYTLARVEASLDASGGEFVVSKGFCLDTLAVPTVDKGIEVAGSGLGSFELGLSGLEAGRSYYVRAYATTAAGTAYGQVLSFQTRAMAVPSPTTEAATGVGAFGAQLRGSLADTASGGMALTARGFRWSQTAGFASASGQDLPAQATAGQGFSAQLQGLTASTTYFFRAYASNALGTGYGAEVSFTTGNQPLPTVQTQAPLGVSQTQALVEGIVTDDAGAVVTARGFCYSTNNNPLVGNDTVLAGAGLGTFTATLRNLISDTTYFYRAFAVNAGGVGYGLVQSFQTSSGSGSITAPLVTTTPVIRTDSNHVMGGVITWDGNSSISSQGICWNRTGMPTLSDSVTLFTPQGLGSFTLAVQLPLGCHEPFYVRAFAQNAVGVSYGNEFMTTNGYQPRLIGTQMTQIGGLTANLQSNVVTTGGCPILERGVCWGTSPNPTNSNSFYGRTVCSPDTGVMNCQLNHLFPQTLYYARAYMVNATGTYYGDEVTFTTDTTSELYIGKLHAGGLIFYLDSTRQHGMVCTPNDLGDYQWGCHGTDIPNTSTSFGAGFMNTSLITLNCAQRPIAASVCADLVLNGYSDWFLPSIGELQLMYSRLHLQGLGGFGGFWYWSSSQEQNPDLAWTMGFVNGGFNHDGFSGKNYYSRVRAVRAF